MLDIENQSQDLGANYALKPTLLRCSNLAVTSLAVTAMFAVWQDTNRRHLLVDRDRGLLCCRHCESPHLGGKPWRLRCAQYERTDRRYAPHDDRRCGHIA